MRTKKRKILWMMFLAFGFCAAFQSHCVKVEAKIVKRDVTPREPSSSDLQVVRKVTKLASKRWIQSFTMDSKYYYCLLYTSPSPRDMRRSRMPSSA